MSRSLRPSLKKISTSPLSVKKWVGHGCGKIIGKCKAWTEDLHLKGCKCVVIIHDLDKRDIGELRRSLAAAMQQCASGPHVIVIPIHEIEAWLLADQEAIKRALKLRGSINQIPNPEALIRPKETLRDLIWQKSEKRLEYLNTLHNEMIAKECSLPNLSRCASFLPLANFIQQYFGPKKKRKISIKKLSNCC